MTTNESILSARLRAIQVLGGKCVKCGMDDSRTLSVVNLELGAGKILRKTTGREKYFLLAIRAYCLEPGKCPWCVMCANCRTIHADVQFQKKLAKDQQVVEAVQPSVKGKFVVWKAAVDRKLALEPHAWLDSYIKSGLDVFILLEGKVYEYKKGLVAEDWQGFKALIKQEIPLPTDSVTTIGVKL